MKTYWFWYGTRIVGVGRGNTEQEAMYQATEHARMIDRDNISYIGRGHTKTYPNER